jgi:drug/metabolite transporter (DMT)-like permease
MPAAALAFALAAACFHALWNLLLAKAPDVESATVVALVTAVIGFAPIAVVTWKAEPGLWKFVLASGLLELVYFAMLATAYRLAPLSVVYPVARGGAPVVVLLISVIFLGYETSARQVAAVALIVAGILLVRGFGHANAAGLAFGVAIACTIASYTLVDKHGITHSSPITYLVLTMLIPVAGYGSVVTAVKGGEAVRAAITPAACIAGITSFIAYALTLAALERASAASVAAIRETSVVIAAGLSVAVLHEHVTRWRFLGACVVVAGIALLATG